MMSADPSTAPTPRHHLRDLLAAYLDELQSLNHSPTTLRSIRYNNQSFLGWLEETCRVRHVDQLRGRHLPVWLKYLSTYRTSRGRALKPRSVNKRIETVRGFLRYLAREGYVHRALTDRLVYVKEPSILPTSVLTHAQVKSLLDVVDTSQAQGYCDRTMLELLYSSGIRVAELLGLNLDGLDLPNATALVMGKGRKQRVVPMGRTALRFLENYLGGIRPHLQVNPEERALFLDASGQRYPYHTLRRRLHVYAAKAGIDIQVTPHTFRRSCTTEMLRGGANMYHVKEMLGHESLDTLKHYARLTITDLKKTHRKCHPREKDRNVLDL